MRQVMPHRNNMVADPRRCKSFLHLKTGRTHHFCAACYGRSAERTQFPPIFFET
jgi:hypothetical protein